MVQARTLFVLMAAALVASSVVVAMPAFATHTEVNLAASFMPNDGYENEPQTISETNPKLQAQSFKEKDQLGDAFDGVDRLAHLTVVTEPDADRVLWYHCTTGENTNPRNPTGLDIGGVPGSGDCGFIGSDTTATQPPGTGFDEAYDFFWDIPSDLDDTRRDIVAWACAGEPSSETGNNPQGRSWVPNNCFEAREDTIFLDDAQTDRNIPTGEIVGVCNKVETPLNDCADAEFVPVPHGGVVPNAGFTLRFRTSNDVTPASACLDEGAGAQQEPLECDTFASSVEDSTPTGSTLNFHQFDAVFTADQVIDNIEMDLAIYGNGTDSSPPDAAECDAGSFTAGDSNLQTNASDENDICVFDEHYVRSARSSQQPSKAVVTFSPGSGTTAATCESPDKEETNQVDQQETVIGCIQSQFGEDVPSSEVTFASSGVGEFSTCTNGTMHDHDNDGHAEHCHTTTASNGEARATITNTADEVGDQTITFCQDDEATGTEAGTETAPSAAHGCADENLKDTAVKHWVAEGAGRVTLVFDDGDGDCDGPTTRTNTVGDTDALVACTFDEQGNASSTTPTGGGSLRWSIQPGTDGTDTAFSGQPEQETGDDNRAGATIEARDPGTDVILVELLDDQGNVVGSDSVSKQVEDEEPPPPDDRDIPCTVSGTDNPDNLTGTEGDDVICGFGGDDTLNGLGGDDILAGGFGSDTLNGDAGQDSLEGDEINSCFEGGDACGSPGSDTANGGDGKDTIRGDAGNDVLNGGDKNDLLIGDSGNDELNGENGWDTIRGNVGDDTLRGARGRDILQGGSGNDTARGGSNDDTMRGFTGSDRLIGHAGDDIIKGGTGNDILRGGSGDDMLSGGAGRDSCRGGPGSDVLRRCETR